MILATPLPLILALLRRHTPPFDLDVVEVRGSALVVRCR